MVTDLLLPCADAIAPQSKNCKLLFLQAENWSEITLEIAFFFVISGSETKTIEGINVSDTQILPENLFSPTSCFRFASAAAALNYSLYITSGLTWENPTEICSYVLRHYTWRQYDKMNFNRNGHALVFMCDVIYIFGGNFRHEESAIGFNTRTYETKTLPQMIYARSNVVALVFDGEIFAIGGIYNEKPSCLVEKFNPLTSKWKTIPNLKVARNPPGACVINNQIVVAGGGSSAIEIYDKEDATLHWKIEGKCEELYDAFAIFRC